jgi:protein-tyrosine phosphatase
VRVLHAPFDDSMDLTPVEIETIYMAAHEVARHITKGRRTLVTCMAGRNRSGIVCALALHLLTGEPGERVLRHIRKRRVAPDGGKALVNPLFVDMLRDLPAISESA